MGKRGRRKKRAKRPAEQIAEGDEKEDRMLTALKSRSMVNGPVESDNSDAGSSYSWTGSNSLASTAEGFFRQSGEGNFRRSGDQFRPGGAGGGGQSCPWTD